MQQVTPVVPAGISNYVDGLFKTAFSEAKDPATVQTGTEIKPEAEVGDND